MDWTHKFEWSGTERKGMARNDMERRNKEMTREGSGNGMEWKEWRNKEMEWIKVGERYIEGRIN